MEIVHSVKNPVMKKLLWTLSDGRAFTAIELADYIKVNKHEIIRYLEELEQERILERETHRHQYFRLNVEVNLETLYYTLKPEMQDMPKIYSDSDISTGLKYCRSCHNHLAGKLGRDLTQKLQDKGYLKLERSGEQFQFKVAPSGIIFFKGLGLDTDSLIVNDEMVAKACLDFSERKHHLGGRLGVALLDKMKEKGWIFRKSQSRIHYITPTGKAAFIELLGMESIFSEKSLKEI